MEFTFGERGLEGGPESGRVWQRRDFHLRIGNDVDASSVRELPHQTVRPQPGRDPHQGAVGGFEAADCAEDRDAAHLAVVTGKLQASATVRQTM
jgi:hypothetical protein